ncbi:hypothetical protein [Ferrimonas marina]|uniref:Uncharacterized protein n=1 Tax=Ferrimonas marina TaxID=299255 RepID=A0A1M5YVA7_9GAMM|nr:hypothetical protein [Ferrimonas marina]SHI15483.1 hypothetical protein SAMN02745129_4440 [Ferrimonas marina]
MASSFIPPQSRTDSALLAHYEQLLTRQEGIRRDFAQLKNRRQERAVFLLLLSLPLVLMQLYWLALCWGASLFWLLGTNKALHLRELRLGRRALRLLKEHSAIEQELRRRALL